MIRIFQLTIFLLFFLVTSTSFAKAKKDDTLAIRPSMQWYSVLSLQNPRTSSINPDNKALEISDRSLINEFRPQVKVFGNRFTLMGRPLIRHEVSSAEVDGKRIAEHPSASSKWLEAYGLWDATSVLQMSYGIQNYQWGAAETLNPSNRIFHDTADSRGLLTATTGRNIARVNYSWSKYLTSVVMAETEEQDSNSQVLFQYGEVFQTKSLMKHELNWNNGSDYLGFVFGAAETDGPWFGEYFNVTLLDGLALYGDASHEKGSNAWYPVESDSLVPGTKVVQLEQSKIDSTQMYTLAVAGLRYSFVGGSDLRFEYTLNQAGWTKSEMDLGKKAIDSSEPLQLPTLEVNAWKWARPGLEYRGRSLALISLRVPDLFETRDLTWYMRYLHSLQDGSAQGYSSFEYGFGRAYTALLAGLVNTGKQDDELRGFVSYSTTAGLRQDF
jgi:hypothetical protein